MRLFSRATEPEQIEALAAFGLKDSDAEQDQQEQIPWHCGWCQPYVNGATTGICPNCEAEHFPRRGGAR